MSTPDEPAAPQLTRRQLRELRNTASNPVITPDDLPTADAPEPVAPLPRPAEPPVVADEPPAAEDVDLDAPALTRRQARRQERLRTASVPVIDADAQPQGEDASTPLEGDSADSADAASAADALAEAQSEAPDVEVTEDAEAPAEAGDAAEDGSDPSAEVESAGGSEGDAESEVDADADSESSAAAEADAEPAVDAEDDADGGAEGDTVGDAAADAAESGDESEEERPVVAPTFGADLLSGDGVEIELPASFDQLLARGGAATGSIAASNALILSQTPDTGSFASPVTATGEVLITGTFALPESLGSAGTTKGSSDGKDIDAILVDGELPASSSPTPIAASSAISTIKSAEDIIKPPAPEKGSRLMLALVITAGALALALTGALIVALVTGVFR